MHRLQPNRRRSWLLGVTAAALLAGAAQAQTTFKVQVGGGALDAALLGLAAQTHQRIFFQDVLVADLRAPRVAGAMTVDDALVRLLAGSGLRGRRINPDLVIVERIPRVAPEKAAVVTAPPGAAGPPTSDAEPSAEDAPNEEAVSTNRTSTLIEEVTVTGSNIRGARTASPVVTLDRDALARTGQTTLAAALRTLPQNFGGGAGEGNATTLSDRLGRNGAFSTGLNLRGLGSNATLVLVNGRRIAGSGTFGDFADVSSIPTAAVERVDVLLDGASAVYGADAVGGVVNIILRRDFDGGEVRLLAGGATAGEPVEGQISGTFGHRWNTGHVLLAYELQRREGLASGDRRFTESADLRPLGGTDHRLTNSFPGNILRTDPATGAQVPGWAIPAGQSGVGLRPSDLQAGVVNLQNQRFGIDLLPRQTLNAVYVAAGQDVGDRLEVTADARYSARRYRLHIAPPTANLTVNRNNPFFVSPNGSASHTIAYSFAGDLPLPTQQGLAENIAATLGATLKLKGDWQAEGYAAFGQEIDEGHNSGLVNSTFLSEALGTTADRPDTPFSAPRDGYFNPFSGRPGANGAAVTAFIGSGFITTRTRNRIVSASLQADGTVLSLPAGAVKLALGVQARRETLVSQGSNFVSGVAALPGARTDVGRDVTAAFAEVRAPLFGPDNRRTGFERLELSAAGRIEHYEDVGSTTNPKLGLLWSPVEDITLRATYGRSFRAPALREIYDRPLNSPTLLPFAGGRVLSMLLQGGNPDLKPETARSWTAGVEWRPSAHPGVMLSATWFRIRFDDRIDRPVQANLTNALSDPALTPFVTRISPGTSAEDRARIAAILADPGTSTINGVFPPESYGAILDNRYVNTAALTVQGLDLAAQHRVTLGEGQLGLSASASWLFDYRQQVTPTSPIVDRAGVANFPVRFRSRVTADYTRGRLGVGAALNYVGRYRDQAGARIGAWPTVDLQLRLAGADHGFARGVDVTLNARNIFDRDPPFWDNPNGVGFDAANADPVGRYLSLQLTRSW